MGLSPFEQRESNDKLLLLSGPNSLFKGIVRHLFPKPMLSAGSLKVVYCFLCQKHEWIPVSLSSANLA